ncbi:multicopy suppressor of BFA (Brefeldin A) [Kickxella alabastrina]|uniref:Multicopy suppressor of BFA (Brefeldin A) n=1 Tax=Kickxella alabastrina TaxID=61397 RepID=A0ACC1I5E3_9FUNG|nr:multicopy suppressor of BFA (Brefeldin A) [Kickxella alabastrina]
MALETASATTGDARSPVPSRITRPPRPDFEQHKKELTDIDSRIDKLRKEQEDNKDRLNKTDTRKGPHVDKRTQLINRLQDIRTEQNALRKSRGKVFDRRDTLAASIAKKTAELKTQQAKLSFKSVEDIDEIIAKHEVDIDSGKLKLVDERRMSSEVSSLRRARKHVEQAATLQKTIASEVAELTEIDAQLAGTNAQALGDEFEKLQSELDTLKAAQEEGHQKRSDLFSERSSILKALDQAWDLKRKLQDEHRRQNNEYYQWQNEERKRKILEEKQRHIQEQREKRLAIAQEQREEAEIPAFQDEINGCDSLILYLNSIIPSAAGSNANSRCEDSTRPSSVSSGARETSGSEHVPAGMVAVKRADNDEAYYGSVISSKSKRRNNRKDKKAGAPSDVLKLPLAVAERFLDLKVEIPTNGASIPAAIEGLTARKQHFVGNQAKVTGENKRKAEEKIAKLMAELDVDEKIAMSSE